MHIYDNLHVCQITKEQAARTCGPYYFLVTTGAMSFTAFCTEAGFMQWLNERGLKLSMPLVAKGEHQYQAIVGSFADCQTMDAEAFNAMDAEILTRELSNADYTLAKIITVDGVRQVHYLNPNCHDRIVYPRPYSYP